MFDQKKVSDPDLARSTVSDDNKEVDIHTMQDDLDALSGIFSKKEAISESGRNIGKANEIKSDKSKIVDINTKRQEKRYEEQEIRIETFIVSTGMDDENSILRAWEEYLKV